MGRKEAGVARPKKISAGERGGLMLNGLPTPVVDEPNPVLVKQSISRREREEGRREKRLQDKQGWEREREI